MGRPRSRPVSRLKFWYRSRRFGFGFGLDSDNDDNDDTHSIAPTLTTSAAPEPAAADAAVTEADCCEVCLVAPREGFALVLCEHTRFCDSCANRMVGYSQQLSR